MKRRSFLRHAVHSLAVPGVVGSLGFSMPSGRSMQNLLRLAADTDKVLVMIFLEGGNDGLNTIIPLDRLSQLNAVRPHVMLDEDDILPLQQSSIGLHPSLPDLKTLYDESRLQIVQNVGYPDPNYSHFRSTDIWMSGSDANQLVSSGWAGRHLETQYPGYPEAFPNDDLKDPLSVEIGYGSSLLFQGIGSATSVTLNNVDSFYELVDNIEQAAPDTPAGEKLKFVRLIARQSQQYGERIVEVASQVKNHVEYPSNNYLADQLKVVSKLIAGGSRTPLYMVRLGGFDTHDSQVDPNDHSQGEHADLLKLLNDGIAAFMKDLEYHKVDDRVLGMTFSEFGRRIVSNASLGTDHGAAAPVIFFGNAVKGGVVGSNPVVESNMGYDDNLPHEIDFRQLYGSVLEQWFGIDSGVRSSVLMNDFSTIEIIGEGGILSTVEPPENNFIAYPNPLKGSATIEFIENGTPVSIDLIDVQGKKVQDIYRGASVNGRNSISWNTNHLSKGRYFLVLKSERKSQVFGVVK